MFSDGTPITADDVVFSLQRLIGMKGNPSFLLDGVDVAKKDDTTVMLTSRDAQRGPAVHPAQPGARLVNCKVVTAERRHHRREGQGRAVPQRRLRRVRPVRARVVRRGQPGRAHDEPEVLRPDKPAYDTVVIRNVEAATQKLNVQRGDTQVALDLSGDQVTSMPGHRQVTITDRRPLTSIFLLAQPGLRGLPATTNPSSSRPCRRASTTPGCWSWPVRARSRRRASSRR